MDRVECNQTPPNINQPREILERLLQVELERLETAVRIERERSIVFPETSVIIRDVQKLNNALNTTTTPTSGDGVELETASVEDL